MINTASQSKERPKEIVRFFERQVACLKDNRFFSFKLGDDENYIVATAGIDFDDDSETSICYTMNSGNVYLTVSDGDPQEVSLLMAYIKSLGSEFSFGNVVEISDSEYLQKYDRCGAVFLVPETLPILEQVPNEAIISGIRTKFLLIVFLNRSEMEIMKDAGFDSLLDYFIKKKRDVIRLSSINH